MLCLLIIALHVSAQEVIINQTTLLIAEGKYNDAEKYLDSIIHSEPHNVTALMMKGNVLLNYALIQTPSLKNITLQDESILTKDVATLKNNIVIIPRATATKVEQLWKQCIALDSSRLDIQKGLCSLYGMSLMRKELVGYLPIISRSARDKGDEFAYTLMEYPHLLLERGDKEGAGEAYQKVIALYPNTNGLWCQLALVHFDEGDLTHTRQYVEKAVSSPTHDMSACREALEIYTAISEPQKVLAMIRKTHKDTVFNEYCFYLALDQYAHHDSTWRKSMNIYLGQFSKSPDSNALFDAARFMVSKNFTNDYKGTMSLLNYNINDFSTRLITDRAMQDYKDSIMPYILSAQVAMNDKDYLKAAQVLKALNTRYPGQNDMVYYYAYALYCAGDYRTALDKWSQYAEAARKTKFAQTELDRFLAVPYYFIGQCHLRSGDKAKVIEYFKMILAGKDDSKYAYLAKVQLDNLSK